MAVIRDVRQAAALAYECRCWMFQQRGAARGAAGRGALARWPGFSRGTCAKYSGVCVQVLEVADAEFPFASSLPLRAARLGIAHSRAVARGAAHAAARLGAALSALPPPDDATSLPLRCARTHRSSRCVCVGLFGPCQGFGPCMRLPGSVDGAQSLRLLFCVCRSRSSDVALCTSPADQLHRPAIAHTRPLGRRAFCPARPRPRRPSCSGGCTYPGPLAPCVCWRPCGA